jgi:UV DNA damage endonuclease
VIENDDKVTGWSVKELVEDFHPKTQIPVTFDYLHHKLHPNKLIEEEAFNLCYETWGNFKPLFHYSESREGNNPRAHADYAQNKFTVYKDCDVDFELKMKDKAIQNYQDKYESQTVSA